MQDTMGALYCKWKVFVIMKKANEKKPENTGAIEDSNPGSEVVPMSLRLDRSQYERLRQLAFDRRKPMRTFIVQGIEQILKAENR
jgi:hypothetical protein